MRLFRPLRAGLLVATLLTWFLMPPSAQAQEVHRVGVGFGIGRSYQIGTPGGSIDRPYMRFRSGPNHILSVWYENEQLNSRWTLRGGLSWAERGYWMAQERFANPWFREAYFKIMPTYDFVSCWMSAGYSLWTTERIRLEAFAGLSVSMVGLSAFTGGGGSEGANVTPLDFRVRYDYQFSQRAYTTAEPLGGLNLRWRTERKFFRRLSYWLVCSVPTRSLDHIGYWMEETHRTESTVYEGRWRSRMANWTLGLSYDLYSWGRAKRS